MSDNKCIKYHNNPPPLIEEPDQPDIYCLIEAFMGDKRPTSRLYFNSKAPAIKTYHDRIVVLDHQKNPYHICIYKAAFTRGILDLYPTKKTTLMEVQKWDWTF